MTKTTRMMRMAAMTVLAAACTVRARQETQKDDILSSKTIGIVRMEFVESGEADSTFMFPIEQNAQWYRDVLVKAGCTVTYLAPGDLLDATRLSTDAIDLLIFPYGMRGAPLDVENHAFLFNLGAFMKSGGHVLSSPGTMRPYDAAANRFYTQDEADALRARHDRNTYKLAENFPLFDVFPEYLGKTAVPPTLNPEFRGLCPALPGELDVSNAWPAHALRLDRHMLVGAGFKDDLLLPLYFTEMEDSRGNTRRAGPIWIVRHHCRRFHGSTMIVTFFRRWANSSDYARMFSGDYGPELLKALVRLCFQRLPGERPDAYYETKLTLKREAVAAEKRYVAVMHELTAAQQKGLYRGDAEARETLRTAAAGLEKRMSSLIAAREKAFSESDEQAVYAAVLDDVRSLRRELDAVAESLSPAPPSPGDNTFTFSIQYGKPDFLMCYENFATAAAVGIDQISFGYYHEGFFADFFHRSLGLNLYAGLGGGGHHQGISRIPCSAFNPTTLEIGKAGVKKNWLYSEECYRENMQATRERVLAIRDKPWLKMYHLPNEMHIRWNQGWGERGMALFREHLREAYGAIEKVNDAWGTEYDDFTDIVVPIRVPESAVDHARWDDWTRFRDHFISRYAQDLYTLAKDLDPNTPVLSRYKSMWTQATKANDYTTLNRFCDINGSHGYYNGNLYTCDWLERVGRKPFYNSEYTFHKYTKTGFERYTRWLRRDLWHGTGNGQVGFQFFPWYWDHVPSFESYSFLESDGTPRIVVWELEQFIRRSSAWSKIVTEGESMERASIALLYSDTTRRHQIESLSHYSPMFTEAEGWNALFRTMHTAREVLTEWDLRHDAIPESVKLIVLPDCAYLEPATYEKLKAFAEDGGWIFAVNSTGVYYDHRGREDFTLFGASEVVSRRIPEPRFFDFDGRILTEFGQMSAWYGWKTVADESESEPLVSAAEGDPTVLKAPIGRGGIVFCSLPLGTIYNTLTQTGLLPDEFPENALLLQDIVKATLSLPGVRPTAEIEDPLIEVHPWYYQGETYLVFANLRTERDALFTVTLPRQAAGVHDLLNDTRVPIETANGKTTFDLYLAKGGGLVVRLIE